MLCLPAAGLDRDAYRQHRALIAGSNFKRSTNPLQTFLHCKYSKSGFSGGGHASAKIFDLQDQVPFLFFQAYDGVEAAGMEGNISQSFLRNAKKMSLYFLG